MKIKVTLPHLEYERGDYDISSFEGTAFYDGWDMPMALYLVRAGHANVVNGSYADLEMYMNDTRISEEKTVTTVSVIDATSNALEELRMEYSILTDEEPDGRWGVERLKREIQKAHNELNEST